MWLRTDNHVRRVGRRVPLEVGSLNSSYGSAVSSPSGVCMRRVEPQPKSNMMQLYLKI